MANLHHAGPKIDFLTLHLESLVPEKPLYIRIFPGNGISPKGLSESRKQLELLAPPNVKILASEEIIDSDKERTIGIMLESNVRFDPNFFESLLKVFCGTNTFCLYSDFHEMKDEELLVHKLPIWSPIRFESVDYLGPVVAFDLAIYSTEANSNSISRDEVIAFAQTNNLQISRVPFPLYDCEPEFLRKENKTVVLPVPESISVVIPTKGLDSGHGSLLESCVAGLVNQTEVSGIELIVVADKGYDERLISRVKGMLPKDFSFKIIEFNEAFNFSSKCNLGASQATGDSIVFLNDDVELKSADSIAKLASWSFREGVGAVGSQLHFTDGSIQHAGITLKDVKPRNSYLDQFPRVTDLGDLEVNHEVSGVTGACLAISKGNFQLSGGWNEELPNSYNDVDLCLRLSAMGQQSLVLNDLNIVHNESSSRDAEFDIESFKTLKTLWPDALGNECYLRSGQANGYYQGPWGLKRDDRDDLKGKYFAFTIHLLIRQGLIVTFKQLASRVSGKTQKTFSVPKHEYL